jgi:hypothetical protein
MIPAGELARIQSDAAAATLDQTCVIQRKTTTPGTSGEPVGSWTTIATVMAGMSEPTAGQLQNYDFMIGSLAAWQVKLPVGTTVTHQDHFLIAGQVLEVQVILNPRSYPALLTVLASEVK